MCRGTSVGDRLLDLRLPHQHLHFGAQLARMSEIRSKAGLPGDTLQQATGVAVDVADLELAVDQDAGRDEVAPGRIEQDVLEAQWRRRLADSLVLVEPGRPAAAFPSGAAAAGRLTPCRR
jgi:hypothetical protein